jgi:isoquinoline 1-oxidoreductase alpha subunit
MQTLNINGKAVEVQAEPDTPLLWVLRGELHLTGTKFGCGMALCGACTVHVNGEAVRSCVAPAGDMAGKLDSPLYGMFQMPAVMYLGFLLSQRPADLPLEESVPG